MKKLILLLCILMACVLSSAAEECPLAVEEVFERASRIDGFQSVEYMEDYDIRFPSGMGTPQMIIHWNAEPREAVLSLLGRLPEGLLVYDYTDERGRFDRVFLDRENYDVLYVHLGFGGNDSVLILFRDGDRSVVDSFIRLMTEEMPQR